MKISSAVENEKAKVSVEGRIDTVTAPELEGKLKEIMPDVTELVLDLSELIYISSAGLRVLLAAHKTMMKKNGTLIIANANEDVLEIFSITGFSKILNIKNEA